MKNFFFTIRSKQKTGTTLTELLVASILIGIVMLGVAVFSFTVKNIQESANKTTLLSLRTSAVMSHITKNANQAVGDATDVGIVIGASGGQEWLSFRRDTADTPTDYSDDTWSIYRYNDAANTLKYCEQTTSAVPDTGANCSDANSVFLTDNVLAFTPAIVEDSSVANLDFYVQITLKMRYYPDQSVDPIDNPEYSMETRISPASHSW